MAFDSQTRNALANLVAHARGVLVDEFTKQLQEIYGIQPTGEMTDLAKLTQMDDEQLATAGLLRDRIHHLAVGPKSEKKPIVSAVDRLIREQSFTVLNRFAALRMCEERGILQPCVGAGVNAKGFQVYLQTAGAGLGEQYDRYRTYLYCVFDEIAVDLGVLFDRYSTYGLLFPREPALLELLDILNRKELAHIWMEDEAIGWIYQYYNDPAERKEMRDESAAPRNSRELAVRNQFFTPRYVVEFLTDNTLGRIWYEMTQGDTTLKEQCRYLVRRPTEIFLAKDEQLPPEPRSLNPESSTQEDLLRQPVHIPHRPLKDPRTILMLDPACGSMHFGLYAFDLFEVIYDEAWALEEKLDADALSRAPGMKSLHDTYAGKDAFLKDVPRLIIEHNLHGIDIDPRCAQLREFVEREFPAAERAICLRLLEAIFDKMQLAGAAGSLLKIEEEIRSAIEDARDAWQKLATKPPELFTTTELNQRSTAPELTGLEQAVSSLTTAPRHLTTDFWERIEERIYAALRDYAEQAENGGFQRRLFAEDAARGFAFIDVCRKRYDVVGMNPPFGEAPKAVYLQFPDNEVGSSREIASLFLTRALQVLTPTGRVGVIATRMLLFLDQLDEWREQMFKSHHLSVLADFGIGVLDAVVDTAAMVVASGHAGTGFFFRLLSAPDKETGLQIGVASPQSSKEVFLVENRFDRIPGFRVAYWAPAHWLNLFRNKDLDSTALVSKGLETGEDERFLRLHVEVPVSLLGRRWRRYAKGGDYQPFAGNHELVVDFNLFPIARRTTDSAFYGKAGITYTQRTTSFLSFRALPQGNVFSPGGPAIIPKSEQGFEVLISYLSCRPLGVLIELCVGSGDSAVRGGSARNYTTGIMKRLPCLVGRLGSAEQARVRRAVQQRFHCVLKHQLLRDEVSPNFVSSFQAHSARTVRGMAIAHANSFAQDAVEVIEADWEIDGVWRNVFGFSDNDSATLDSDFARHPSSFSGGSIPESFWASDVAPDEQGELGEEPAKSGNRQLVKKSHIIHRELESVALRFQISPRKVAVEPRFNEALIAGGREFCEGVLSQIVGCAFGRWDIRYTTGEQAAPELPDPFAPLPICPPGQLQNAQGLPARPEDVTASYPVRIPWDGILVDDPNHPLDIERRVREVIEIIWGGKQTSEVGCQKAAGEQNLRTPEATAESIEHEACEILGVKALRDYFGKPAGFFADHLKRYSKSRRQAPIYWPLSTESGSYTLWIYYHRLDDQMLFKCVTDFVEPKLKEVSRDIERLQRDVSAGGTSNQRDELDGLLDLRRELEDFKSELLRVAHLPYKPDLNDGVIINAAPLWMLFRLKKCQKDCKACWDKLSAGDYDWAHMAYNIWPDRVREKCKTDKSLAIAHDLEALYEAPVEKTKKKRAPMKKAAQQEVDFDED
jgi:hypothetical protein